MFDEVVLAAVRVIPGVDEASISVFPGMLARVVSPEVRWIDLEGIGGAATVRSLSTRQSFRGA
ncbi:MAG TPA: hypothetical protein VNT24_05410 [Propionibacteriaceae bacterium]|nr:hypothetical protein [Propionibacteriaceae bacterium]